jgi:HD superfamily phosphohydrolase YqeK
MNLHGPIESAEHQFKQILEEFFISVYDERFLSSHGIDHHRRVWNYAKELLNIYPLQNSRLTAVLPSKLIVACFLHDIGMSVEPGAKHGKFSKDFCIKFLTKNHLNTGDWLDVLEAIEYHDNKDYSVNEHVNELMTILSVADDLDAFGFTGIFRYSEIYLERGIKPILIGHLIKENAAARYNNFIRIFIFNTGIVQKHNKKYEILENFFSEYNKQAAVYRFGEKQPFGYCGVVDLISQTVKDKKETSEFFEEVRKYHDDPVVKWYFDGLKSELY